MSKGLDRVQIVVQSMEAAEGHSLTKLEPKPKMKRMAHPNQWRLELKQLWVLLDSQVKREEC